jgi:ATP-dependent Lon protease
MVIPHENLKDLPDLPAQVRDALEIVPVHGMEEVLAMALRRSSRSRHQPVARGRTRPVASRPPAGYAH